MAEQRRFVERFGVGLEVMAVDIGSILLDSLYNRERAAATAEGICQDIRAAGGVATLKDNVQMAGITRTDVARGRGGVSCSAFEAARYDPARDAQFSYWGVGPPAATAGTAASR